MKKNASIIFLLLAVVCFFAQRQSASANYAYQQQKSLLKLAPPSTFTVNTLRDNANNSVAALFQEGDIAVTKTGPDTAQANTNITYTITVTSSGPDDVTSASLNDDLPPGTTFVSLSKPASWSCSTPSPDAAGTVNCTNSLVPAGANDVFTLTVHLDSGVSPGTFITNQAVVDGFPNDNTENDSSPATTLVPDTNADIGVTKTANVDSALPDRDITYTITVTNSGPDAAANAALNDPLPGGPPAMTFVSLSAPVGWSCSTPSPGAAGAVNCTNPSLAVTAGQVFTLVGHIPPDASAGTTYQNTVTVSTTTADPTAENNSSSAGTTVFTCLTNPIVTTNADSGVGSLRQAIADACVGATINFDMSQVVSPITLTTGELLINRDLTIQGPGSTVLTVTRNAGLGGSNFGIFNIGSGTVDISGLSITNGHTANGVTGADGGGISNAGTLSLTGIIVSDNQSGNGTSGTGGNGGGIFNSGTLTLTDCTVSGNHTGTASGGSGAGGGIFSSGTLTINNSTISGNRTGISDVSGQGGGIYSTGTFNLNNSTISGNLTLADGGGISNSNSGVLTVTNCTITNNRSDDGDSGAGSGGGIFQSSGTVTLRNTIVAGNFQGSGTNAGDINGTVDPSSSFNLIGAGGSGGLTNANSNQVGVSNPGLDVLAANGGPTMTHAQLLNSPALDAGSNTLATNAGLTTDQRGAGFARILDGPDANATATVDIGAFEAQVSIEDISDKTTNEDTQLQFTFNVGDAGSITSATASSSNTTLVPNNAANIVVTGSGSTRTLTINPAANRFGTSTITVTVNGANSQTMSDTFVLTVNPVADTPSVTGATTTVNTQTTSGLVITTNPVDGAEVNNFKITGITNGTLFKNDGTTQLNNGDFITFAEGNAGLKFTPAANLFSPTTTFSFQAQGATDGLGNGTGAAGTGTITVNAVADTPSVTNATTNEDTQTTSGLVISRNAADSTEVTHFKITGITNGTLFQNNGTTQINNGDFITFAQGNAGLKFTPAANLFSPTTTFSFTVQASTSNVDAGLGGSTVNATITVNPIADTPSVTNATTQLNTQTTSGLVISRNVADSSEVTHFKITNIV